MKLFRQIGGQGGEAGRRADRERAGALAETDRKWGSWGWGVKTGWKLIEMEKQDEGTKTTAAGGGKEESATAVEIVCSVFPNET